MKESSLLHNLRRLAIAATAILWLAACAVFQGGGFFQDSRRGELYADAGLDLKKSPPLWSVEEVRVTRGLTDERSAAEAALILALLFNKAALKAAPGAPELRAVVHVSERIIVRDFMTKNAVVVETRAYREGPQTAERRPLVMAVYADETCSTVASAAYLYDLLTVATAAYLVP
jgi:hypothetical protein